MRKHGGNLRDSARQYGIPSDAWLDLSTGISPFGWEVPPVPGSAWLRLPEEEDGLEAAARAYYGSAQTLAVAGSQAAILALPRLRPNSRVSVLDPGYAEHALAWREAGHTVLSVAAEKLQTAASDSDVLILGRPNNPTGVCIDNERLLDWRAQLASRGGWLVVDEAFIDATPDLSLAPRCPMEGLIVLRSLGKFFGLAGARVGFVFAQQDLLARLRAELGPWTVAGPSRWIAERALRDFDWQSAARARLHQAGARLASLLQDHGLPPSGGSVLFQWVPSAQSASIRHQLAEQGVLVRSFDAPPSVRFGLPGPEAEWSRLADALAHLRLKRRAAS